MYATTSAPQLTRSMPELLQLPNLRSASDTAAPLCTVPPTVEGPGMVPSRPTTWPVPLGVLVVRLCTRKKSSAYPGWESVNIWSRSSHEAVLSASMVEYLFCAQDGTL